MDCIFCKIAKGEIPSVKVWEDDKVVAFNDINPKAKIHILIVPKRHIESVKDLTEADENLVGKLILSAQKIAKEKSMEGYKLIFNVGKEGGQIVDHLHLHLVSGDVSGV
jgi:histidine triad (HIT) family protein